MCERAKCTENKELPPCGEAAPIRCGGAALIDAGGGRGADGAAPYESTRREVIGQRAMVGAALVPDDDVVGFLVPTHLDVGVVEL